MRLPVGLYSTYILPVACKGVGKDLFTMGDHSRNHIFAEVMLARRTTRLCCLCVFNEYTDERLAIEHVDTHRSQRATCLFGLLLERGDSPFCISFQNAKALCFLHRDNYCTKRDIGTALLMKRDHRCIVHAINMVTCQDEDI